MTTRIGFRFPVRLGLAFAAALTAALALSTTALAQDGEGGGGERPSESLAMRANKGLRLGFGPELLLATDGGPAGGGVVLDGRYGLRAGPTVVAPGGRLGADIISSRFVGTAMPTLRITVPVGFLAPYVTGGLGYGGLSNPGESGLAILGGGGLMIHVSTVVAFGAEITYQHITNSELNVLAIGPSIHFGS